MSLSTFISDVLTSDSPLSESVGNNVWLTQLPQGYKNNTPAIVFWFETQKQHENSAQIVATVSFRCYGGTALPSDAESIYIALRDRLQGAVEKKSSGTLVSSYEISAQQLPPDPDTGWPVYLAKFQIIAEEF